MNRVIKKTLYILVALSIVLVLNLGIQEEDTYALKQPSLKSWLAGDVSAKPGFVLLTPGETETNVVPTTSGLYLIKDGSITSHYLQGHKITSYVAIPDADGDGHKDFVVSTADRILPNVYSISSRTGSVLWTFSPENTEYTQQYLSYQPQITSILTGEAEFSRFLIVTAGTNLYKLSIHDGTTQWVYNNPNNIMSTSVISDITGDRNGDLSFTNNAGEIVALDSQSGKPIWSKQNNRYRQVSSTGQSLWVASSHKSLLLLDINSAEPIWKVSLTESGPKEIKILFHDDFNHDGWVDALVFIDHAHPYIKAVSGKNGTTLWEYKVPTTLQAKTIVVQKASEQSILITGMIGDFQAHSYIILDSTSGVKTKEGLFPGTDYGGSDTKTKYYTAVNRAGILLAGSPKEITYLDDNFNIIWSIPILKSTNFTQYDSEGKEFLVMYANSAKQDTEEINLIQKIGVNDEIVWEYFTEPDRIGPNEGIKNVALISDLNQDGKKDIIGGFSQSSKVIAINGHNGEILWESNLILPEQINTLFQYHDINDDLVADLFVVTNENVYVLQGTDGKILKNWSFYPGQQAFFEPTKDIGLKSVMFPCSDVNKDGLHDLFVVSENEIRLGLTTKTQGLEFYYKEMYRTDNERILINQTKLFQDLTQDGVPELHIVLQLSDGEVTYSIISGSDGRQLVTISDQQTMIQGLEADFNQDGIREVITIESAEEPVIKVLDGGSGSVLWSISGFDGPDLSNVRKQTPFTLVDDMNYDGIQELAIVSGNISGSGLVLEIFDVAGCWQDPYKTFVIQEISDSRMYKHRVLGSLVQNLVIDDKKYLAVVGRTGEEENLMLFDPLKEEVAAIFPVSALKVQTTGVNGLVVFDQDQNVSFWNLPQLDSTVTVKRQSDIASPIRIEWGQQDSIARARIYVNNILALDTKQPSASIHLAEGEHTLGIALFHLNGHQSYQTLTVTVVKTQSIKILMISLTVLWLAIMLFLPMLLRRRLKAGGELG